MRRTRSNFVVALSMLASMYLVLSSPPAISQEPVRPTVRQPDFQLAQTLYWLGSEQMIRELEIVPEQKERLDKLRNDSQTKLSEAYRGIDFKDVKPEDRQAKYYEVMNKVNAETTKEMQDILLPHQERRIKQILMQMRLGSAGYGSAAALGQDDLAAELGITDEQRELLKKKEAELRDEIQKKTQEFQRKLAEESREKLLSVLTAEQRKKLTELQGERYEWKWDQGRRGGGTRAIESKDAKP